MVFDDKAYGEAVSEILSLDGGGRRAVPLIARSGGPDAARGALSATSAVALFRGSRSPEGAMAGLWLYFSYFDEAHGVAQDLDTPEGSYWHAIVHRVEPDSGNAAYWFRKVGSHAVFPLVAEAARELADLYPRASWRTSSQWDPYAFLDLCDTARQKPGSEEEKLALEIQLREWQILFDYCARPAR
jgi:hypothetical protein